MNQGITITAGTIAGLLYFYLMEGKIKKGDNVSYLAPVSTDLLAMGFAGVLLWKGTELKDPTVSFIGAAIIGIHVSQFAAHKVIKQRIGL